MTLEREAREIQKLSMIKKQISDLRQRHGNCLNMWPKEARKRFERLTKEKEQREASVYKLKVIG